ncbi:MazG nucleotide pyrophosphohydrolase domain-containing protein [Paenarthrobacter ureafaciens]|jgi:XTP/dITP diphosphohydrolase|uniref:MazG nucleotide pyrophosphohydrolase domain-containing protein n=1 Tax=Paenarthrobacter ureafaciens TaxID=37931 RepID=UPI001FB41588|nr:MazG nucleotide pyrophosphohydrolase domain-containing protein [Paenarthrobacter ureafaciens]UOD82399.1 nucleotide pyrophosphohydrolase [Paenarthrobacter ureafaciens]WNZ02098.1 MazG nucleotide pyrophosphohydrolase domain-containing protein [Paenarthrobacter ureafaciens]
MPTPTSAKEFANSIDRLIETIGALREHCPWMGALTHESLVEYLIEEAYEVVDSIEAGSVDEELRGELGDVLLQVVLHARLAEERGSFDFEAVAEGINAKMIRRNQHVFKADGSLQESFPASVEEIIVRWDAAKRAEKPERADPFEGIPPHLPALAAAQKSLDRAARAGLAIDQQGAPAAVGPVAVPDSEEALGELLLAVVAGAHRQGLDAERALRKAVRAFHDGHERHS